MLKQLDFCGIITISTWEVVFLADSNITKRALASSLKELMKVQPFSQISVSDICDKCEMNRTSFYYHFKDKYDLVNWIYSTEFIAVARQKKYSEDWDFVDDLCEYFYENRQFFRKTFSMEGQNSFTAFFRDIVVGILTNKLADIFDNNTSLNFYVDFYADAFVCAVKRWLSKKDCMTAQEFSDLYKSCLVAFSDKVIKKYERNH